MTKGEIKKAPNNKLIVDYVQTSAMFTVNLNHEGGTMTREELERGRHRGYRTYGYFWSFCEQNRCCEDCDKWIRFGCELKRKIESIQEKRILRICKAEPYKGEQE